VECVPQMGIYLDLDRSPRNTRNTRKNYERLTCKLGRFGPTSVISVASVVLSALVNNLAIFMTH